MNELDQKMVFISPLGSQKRMMSSAWIQRRAGNATAPHCRETGFISPVISPRPGFRSLLPTDLFIYLFIFKFFNFLAFVGGGAALHATSRRATAVFGSSWPFGTRE